MVYDMQENEPCVFIVDDDDSVRDAICLLMKSVGLPTQTYGSANDFLDRFEPSLRGCIVSDVRMPGISGLALHQELIKRDSKLPIIFITGHGDIPMAVAAVKAGASDFFTKPFRDQDLLEAISVAMDKNRELLERQNQQLSVDARLDTLTRRERQVLDLVIEGKSNKLIAQELNLSARTVEVHRYHMMEKMQVRTIANLMKLM